MQNISELTPFIAPKRVAVIVPKSKAIQRRLSKLSWKPTTVGFSREELRRIVANQID